MSEENRKERVMEEAEELVNEAAQDSQNIDAKVIKEGGTDGFKESVNGQPKDSKAEDQEGFQEEETADTEHAEVKDQTGDAREDGKKEDASGTEKRGFFGKKKEKKDPKDAQIEELTDRVRRTMADFDNFRKRTEKEKSAMFEIGAKDIIERILPVIDNFERGLASVPEDAKGSAFAEGMEMIYKQLLKNLEEAGVKPIQAAGQPFDPNFHNAVMHIEDENLGENVVAVELQKGYMYRDSVVRHSMVQVAN